MRAGSSLFRVGSLKEIVWLVSLSSSLKHCLVIVKVWERTGKRLKFVRLLDNAYSIA